MSISDKAAAAALVQILEDLRKQGRKSCIVETIVCDGVAVEMRTVKRDKGIKLQIK